MRRHLYLLLFIQLFSLPKALARYQVEPYLFQATDASGEHLFLLNPATSFGKGLIGAGVFLQGNGHFNFKDTRNTNVTNTDTNLQYRLLALAVQFEAGSGLNLALQFHKYDHEDETTRNSDSRFKREEKLNSKYTALRATAELTDKLTVGFWIRFLEQTYDLVGNPFVSETTTFKPSFFGSGAGLHFHTNDIRLGGAYLLPLKGKVKVLGEEKIVSEPGIIELTGSTGPSEYVGGIALRRWIYKDDDRHAGTTLNNQSQSSIDLMGLNVEHGHVFILEQRQIGLDYKFHKSGTLHGTLFQNIFELNFDPENNTPGTESNLEQMSYYGLHAALSWTSSQTTFRVGLKMFQKSHSFKEGNQTRDIDLKRSELWVGLQLKL